MEKGFGVFTNKIIFLKLDGLCFQKKALGFMRKT